MKFQDKKNGFVSLLRPLGAALLIMVLVVGLFGKRPAHATSDRAKKVAAVFIGGGTGGGIAAIAGSAKWFPLGFAGGGLAAGLIARHVIKKRRARRAAQAPYESCRTRYRSQHEMDDVPDLQIYPVTSTRRHVRVR